MPLTFTTARTAPRDIEVLGVPVHTERPGASLGRHQPQGARRPRLRGQGRPDARAAPGPAAPTWWSSASVDPGSATTATLRTAAAALARAVAKRASVATALIQATELAPVEAAQAIAEGMTMASYRYVELKSDKTGVPALASVVLLTDPARAKAVADGAERGRVIAEAVVLRPRPRERPARPPHRPRAGRGGPPARPRSKGLQVEVLDEDAIAELRLGGLLAVNQGSVEPPRLVKLDLLAPQPPRPRWRSSARASPTTPAASP